MFEFSVFLAGNLVADPELHTGPKSARVTFTIAVNPPRRYDKQRQCWINQGGTVYEQIVAFGQLARNAATSLHRGDHVTAYGRLQDNSRTITRGSEDFIDHATELLATYIGVDLNTATATVTRNPRAEHPTPRHIDV
ncbi:single-stranded DNA-binding protein [Sciscionella marina]|uniref:single-stranded DNA-binding protein n=1 Tax=Sciscionella marina TaxID=508770 RepID=UPI000364E5E7|nr:single-stranded DNA-binding protein [Sciscionella marina]